MNDMKYAIQDDKTIFWDNLESTEAVLAWGTLVTPHLVKHKLKPEEVITYAERYPKPAEITGKLRLVKILHEYDYAEEEEENTQDNSDSAAV